MPQLRQERSGSDGACPDASTILAVIEGEADEWLRNAYAQHLAQCSACLELDSRLRNFDRPVLADEAAWRRTEKRLDNWLNALVESRATATPQAIEKRAARAGFWESIWRPGLAWKLSLAMGLGALVAVGASVYPKWRPPFWPDQAKVSPPKSTDREAPGPTPPLVPGGVMIRGGPMAAAPEPSQVKPQPKPEENATVAEKGNPSQPQQQGGLEPPPIQAGRNGGRRAPAQEQTTTAARPGKPRPSRTEAAAIAENSTPTVAPSAAITRPETATNTRPATASTARPKAATGPAMENVAVAPVRARTPDAQASLPAVNAPASLHLAAGARLWLALDSFRFEGDGRVIFYGSLLLPLNSKGSSALDHGTEVSGFITSAQGQSSVLLSEIVIRGSHYKLMSQAGAGNARTAGSGGAVQFDSGKVLEMWVSSDSTYEHSTADSTQ